MTNTDVGSWPFFLFLLNANSLPWKKELRLGRPEPLVPRYFNHSVFSIVTYEFDLNAFIVQSWQIEKLEILKVTPYFGWIISSEVLMEFCNQKMSTKPLSLSSLKHHLWMVYCGSGTLMNRPFIPNHQQGDKEPFSRSLDFENFQRFCCVGRSCCSKTLILQRFALG